MLRGCWLLPLVLAGCARATHPSADPPLRPTAVEAPDLHNVYRVSEQLFSGSCPEGDAGFQSLRELGIRTIISVDGARPDWERARRHGLRYVHLPIGYDGVPERQALRLARAVRDLPGPVYLHCHHGKHRGPAAAAVVLLCLNGEYGTNDAVEWLRLAGTDPRYQGLYAAPLQLRRPTPEELDRVPADFPEVAEVTALAQVMVAIDERWTHLNQVRDAGWKVPPNHPDIDPPHEALQLREHYREVGRLPRTKGNTADFRRQLADAEASAAELEALLRRSKETGVESTALERLYRQAEASCKNCHARYRDVPQTP